MSNQPQVNTWISRRAGVAVVAAGLVLAAGLASAAYGAGWRDLPGTWELQIGFVNCQTGAPLGPQFKTLHTYHRDGTLIELGSQVGPPPTADRTPALGIWERAGGRAYRSFFKFFTFDGSSAPLGRIEVDETVELDAGGNTLVAVALGRVFNAAGNQIASNCLAGTGTRLGLP